MNGFTSNSKISDFRSLGSKVFAIVSIISIIITIIIP